MTQSRLVDTASRCRGGGETRSYGDGIITEGEGVVSEAIERTEVRCLEGRGSDMGIDHRRLQAGMTEEFLEAANIDAIFEKMGGKGVPERMNRDS